MTLKYFLRLSERKQYRRLLTRGVCIAERTTGNILLLLFQLDQFYVEIAFDNQSDEVLTSRCFDDTAELKPYLDELDISPLLKLQEP